MTKAHPISVALKLRIAKHKEAHSDVSFVSLSELFHVSYDQARAACKDYASGKLKIGKGPRKKDSEKIMLNNTTDELFDGQFHKVLADLAADDDMPVEARASMLEKVAKIRKALQSVRLEAHLKRKDADIVAAIVRRYEPDASDDRIIEIYKEEVEKLKLED